MKRFAFLIADTSYCVHLEEFTYSTVHIHYALIATFSTSSLNRYPLPLFCL